MHSLRALAARSILAAVVVAMPTGARADSEPFVDADGDGLDDSWEIANFGNITSQDQFGDPDMDGATNGQEYVNHTDPLTYDGPNAPTVAHPACGSEISSLQTVLDVNNAVDPQGTPLQYEFQLFSDPGLTILVAATQPGNLVQQGAGASTSWPVPVNLLENTKYYWRARAKDQFTFGPFTAPAACSFFVNTVNEPPGIPRINSPAFGAHVNSFMPTLKVDNATDPDLDVLRYQFEAFSDPALSNKIASTPVGGVAEGAMGTTSWQVNNPNPALMEDHFYYWHARACDPDNLCGAWSASGQFFVTTTNAPPEAPSILSPPNGSVIETLRPSLLILNADDSDLDPVVYDWDLAKDAAFANIVESANNAPPQGLANTAFGLQDDLTEDTHYCFRVRSDDGQAQSAYSVSCFVVSVTNDVPTTPVPVRPTELDGNVSTTPVFSWMPSTDPEDELVTYDLQVIRADHAIVGSVSGVSGTLSPIDRALDEGATYSWRVRATDRHGVSSQFSFAQPFTVHTPLEETCCQTDASGCQAAPASGRGATLGVGLVFGLVARRRRTVTA